MQHLDEGTIHSWLDGALSADEAARVDAHVKECPQCASAVAEARGFIAASSRILTALDHAPRGVIPIAARRRRIDPFVWRVAATLLGVAAGTLVVVQNRGVKESRTAVLTARTSEVPQSTSVAEQTPAAADQVASASAPATSPATTNTANGSVGKSAVSRPPMIALSKRAESERAPSSADRRENRPLAAEGAAVGQAAAAPSQVGAVAAFDAVAEAEPLRVVGTPRRIGAKTTLYEVSPGDTVTLTESAPVSLQQVVTTGAATMGRRTAEKSAAVLPRARADAAATAAPDSQRGAVTPSAPLPAPAPPSQRQAADAVHTITWTDPETGNTLSLTGRMPEARLQEIRVRIDRERAAAKKAP